MGATDRDTSGWLTVVTISLREDDALRRTLASVEEQRVDGVVHLVVLGEEASPELAALIDSRGGRLLVQEPAGVYSAMNAGWRAATTDAIHFLNGGDTYVDSEVLGHVKSAWCGSAHAWATGRLLVVDPRTGHEHVRGVTVPEMRRRHYRGWAVPEQPATFFRRSTLEALGGFDPRYSIAADYRLILEMVRRMDGIDLELPIARYALGGLSDARWPSSLLQCNRARRDVRGGGTRVWAEEFARTVADFGAQVTRRGGRVLRRRLPGRTGGGRS